MKAFSPKYKYVIHPEKGIQVTVTEVMDAFDVDLLDIGDLKAPSKDIEVLAVMFDLEGFTKFTSQVDPQLTIPRFISEFFGWLFKDIRDEMKDNDQENTLWAELPFFSKFLGDGALFLWRIDLDRIVAVDKRLTSETLENQLQIFLSNIIVTVYDICKGYGKFLDSIRKKYVDPPTKLRSGIARGKVFPIGGGRDFVGPCINIAARLQRLNGLSFAFSARGIDEEVIHSSYLKYFVKKRVPIRGIGDNELIFVLKSEFDNLQEEQKAWFPDV